MTTLPPSAALSGDGLPFLAIANPLATARIYLHGGHVAQWRPAGHGEVLWMSARSQYADDKPLRGGIPVCFPWFGPHPTRPELPAHGFARLGRWTLASVTDRDDGSTRAVLGLVPDEAGRASLGQDAALTLTVTVGATLSVELAIANPGGAPLTCEAALHTYFTVGDIRRASVEGLAGAAYLDRVGGVTPRVQDRSPIAFSAETDRLYPGTTASAVIVDPVLRRRITVAKRGSRSTVVWNPWIAKAARMPDFGDDEWPGMLCVETANVADDRIVIGPGLSTSMATEISVAHDDG
jgi:D-hexose-6-phosphate mutarotase